MDQQVQQALENQNPWWFDKPYEKGIPRLKYYPKLQKYMVAQEIILVVGARRTGKSTLLYQLIHVSKAKRNEILFINLDEPLFQNKRDDPAFLRTLIEEYRLRQKNAKKLYVYIDEVQNYLHWIQTIKTMYDVDKSIKFVITGSTAALLKDIASTRLSGRYFMTIVHPLTFREFLEFTKREDAKMLEKKYAAEEYLQWGGFPRVALEKEEALKQDILKNYFQTIYLKDIILPHPVRNNQDIADLLYFALSNVGKFFSYIQIGKMLNMSADTVKEYINYIEQSYLICTISKYDVSVKKQVMNPRKIYCIDTGLVNAISFRFSENKGRLMENLVGVTLINKNKEVFYHKSAYECDFLVREERKITQAIQVTLSLKDESVKKREVRGLVDALVTHGLKEGIIITEGEEEMFEEKGKKIQVIPLYKWLAYEI